MARGVRKTPIEKLQGELAEVQNSIAQYENCLETMRTGATNRLPASTCPFIPWC